MNTWMVGRVPVAAHVNRPAAKDDNTAVSKGQKTFFLKGRIMAGQADLSANKHDYKEFKWLTKEELAEVLEPEYYRSVRNMLADR